MVYAELIWSNGSGSSSGGTRRCVLRRCLRRLRNTKTSPAQRKTILDNPPANVAVERIDDLCAAVAVGRVGETVGGGGAGEGEVATELTDVAELLGGIILPEATTAPSGLTELYASLGVMPEPVVCGPYPPSGDISLLVVRGFIACLLSRVKEFICEPLVMHTSNADFEASPVVTV